MIDESKIFEEKGDLKNIKLKKDKYKKFLQRKRTET